MCPTAAECKCGFHLCVLQMSVVPERALKLLTWRELEVLVCGDPEVDPDVLQAKATYQGWDADAVGVRDCGT